MRDQFAMVLVIAHTETFFSESYQSEPNLNCNYTFPINLGNIYMYNCLLEPIKTSIESTRHLVGSRQRLLQTVARKVAHSVL